MAGQLRHSFFHHAQADSLAMQIPTLLTERLELVPPDQQCDEAYQRFYTDGGASAAYGGPITPAAAWARLAFDVGAWTLQAFGIWAIRRQAEQDIVGVCGYWQGRGWPRELTWWLLPDHRGRGIAFEASQAAVDHAYDVWGWNAVETYTNDNNAPARQLVAKLGGVQFDRRDFPDGQQRYLYRIPRRTR